jgi:hypothetical protein
MLAFDTPFYSINQNFVTDKAWSSVDQVNKEVARFWNAGTAAASVTAASAVTTKAVTASGNQGGSRSAKKWGLFAGVAGAAILGAAAYVARDKISSSLQDAYDQLTFISDLTDMHGCDQRYIRKFGFGLDE